MEKFEIYADACASKVGGGVGMVVVENGVKIAEGGWFDSTCKDATLAKDMEIKAFQLALTLAKELVKRNNQVVVYSDNNAVLKGFVETKGVTAEIVTKQDNNFMSEADKLSRSARVDKVNHIVTKVSLSELIAVGVKKSSKVKTKVTTPVPSSMYNVKQHFEEQIKDAIEKNNAVVLGIHIDYCKVLEKDGLNLSEININCDWKKVKSVNLAFQIGRLKELIVVNMV